MPAIVLHFVRRLRQFRLVRLRQSRQSEIQNLGVAVFRQEQVFGLQIAMNNSLFMRRRKSLRNLYPVIDDLPNRQRTALQSLAQRFAFQQFRNQVRRTLVDSHLVHGQNIRMIQGGSRTRLLLESMQPIGIQLSRIPAKP